MSLLKLLLPIAAAALLGVVAIAFADSGTTMANAARAARVQLHRGSLGRHLVDGHGRTLYLFEKDRGGRSACYGGCAAVWPPFIASGRVTHGAGVSAPKLGTVARRGGGREVTYGGHPLYYYAGDSRPGQINGEGLNQFGAPWDIVAPSGRGIDR